MCLPLGTVLHDSFFPHFPLYFSCFTLGFAESSGDQTIQLVGEGGPQVAYTYSPLQDTRNALTLESMGKGSSSTPTYAPFFEYSGAYDYGNQVITAAFQGSKTSFPNNSSNVDFSIFDKEGRAGT